MRVLSLLLVLVLAVGLIPTAAFAASYEDSDLPNPVEGYDPLDPDNPYPYGLPVTEYIPEDVQELIDSYQYGVSLMAADNQGSIPDEMWDNTILRALEYTGYDVQRQKDKGQLYEYRYIGSRLPNNDPDVLSDITYWTSGWLPNGDNTVEDSSTPTGKAPAIATFEKYGMVCASFATYYLCNYLPNIEGIDTSVIYNKAKELGTDSSTGNYYLTTVSLWKRTLDALAKESGTGVTKYTDEDTAYENLVPGDVVIFGKSDGTLTHVAIYAGEYNLYSYGNNLGVYHYMIHVGNSRGPEISIIEWMSTSSSSKASDPVAFYHLDFNDIQTEGFIEVNKTDPNGAPLAGAYFTATDQATGTKYVIGPTNSAGYAISGALPLSKFTVVESVYPDGYQASGTTSWEVELTKDTPNMTITIEAVNELITGSLTVRKATTTGVGVELGWSFRLWKVNSDNTWTHIADGTTKKDKNDPTWTITGLLPGKYVVQELSSTTHPGFVLDTESHYVTVEGNKTATVTVTNTQTGTGRIQKQTNTGKDLEGWLFNVYSDAALTQLVSGSPFKTDESGNIDLELLPSTYYVQEVDQSDKYPDWDFDTQVKELKVTAGNVTTVVFDNSHFGYAELIKETNTGENRGGWKFNLYYADSMELVSGSPFVTGDDGRVQVRLLPGTYVWQEMDESEDKPFWTQDTAKKEFTVAAGETATITVTNIENGRIHLIKEMPDGGDPAGWEFDIYRVSDGAFMGTYQTGTDGTIDTGNLLPDVYEIYERLPDDSIYWCESENPQTVTVEPGKVASVTFVNRIKPGKISVLKVDLTDTPRADAEFLLEWSEDGVNWAPVEYTDSQYVTKGTCTSEGLTEGRLVTGSDGVVTFTGLHPEMQYRLTETKAPDGLQLLTKAAYEGGLSVDQDLTVQLKVVNAPIFTLPETGGNEFAWMSRAVLCCLYICAGAVLLLIRKPRKKEL